MPTGREREYYAMGFRDGQKAAFIEVQERGPEAGIGPYPPPALLPPRGGNRSKPKRKLTAWNKYVKANSKKPRFRLRSGSPNLKKLAVAFRKTPAGKKSKRR